MNKSLLTFLLLVLAFALPGYAQEEKTIKLTTSNVGVTTNYTTVTKYSDSESGISFAINAYKNAGFQWNKTTNNCFLSVTSNPHNYTITSISFSYSKPSKNVTITAYKSSTPFEVPTTVADGYAAAQEGTLAQSFNISAAGSQSANINDIAFSLAYTSGSNAIVLSEINITYIIPPAGPVDYNFAVEDMTLEVGESKALSLGDKTPVFTWNSTNTEVAEVVDGAVVAKAAGEATISATWDANDNFNEGSGSFKVSVTAPKQDVNLSFFLATAEATVGTAFTAPALIGLPEGATVSYSSSNTNVATVAEDGTVTLVAAGETTITASFAGNDSYKPTTASYVLTVNPDPNAPIVEKLTISEFGASGTSYKAYSYNSPIGITYSAFMAAGNDAIQLRTTNSNEGIIVTANKNGYVLKAVDIEWNSNTDEARTLSFYGSDTAYSAVADLFSTEKQGNEIGSLTKSTGTTHLEIEDKFAFIGIRSADAALYANYITLTWEKATPKVATPVISFNAETNTVTITCATEGAAVEYSLDGENYQPYSEPFVIEQSCTVSARATKDGMNGSAVATLGCTWTDLNAVAAPTFSLEEGEYLYGTELTISTAEGCTLTVMIGDDFIKEFENGEYTFNLVDDVEIIATASKNDTSSEDATAIYLVRAPKAPVPSVPAGQIIQGTTVTFTYDEVESFSYIVADAELEPVAEGQAEGKTFEYTFSDLGNFTIDFTGKILDKEFNSTANTFEYEVVEKPADEYYVLVTDASQLQNGDKIVVAGANSTYYAMTNTTSSSSRITATAIDVTDNYIALDPEQTTVGIFTLEEGTTAGTFALKGEKGFVYGSSTNTSFSTTANYSEVTFAEDGAVSIIISSDNRTLHLYQKQDFRGYSSNAANSYPVYFFKKSQGLKHDGEDVKVTFAGEDCGYTDNDVKFNISGVSNVSCITAVATDSEGTENSEYDVDTENTSITFTNLAAHTYTITVSVGPDFTYAPTTATSAPVHVLPVVEFNPQEDYQVGVTDNQIVVMPGGTNYTISSYSHPNLSLYYKKVASQAQPSPNAEDANAGYTKYADEPIFLENGNELTYYFGNEAGDKFGLTTLKAVLPTGIEGIEVSADDNAEYYNLQGVRVSADNLTSGLYIRLQGNTATKVMVKQAR